LLPLLLAAFASAQRAQPARPRRELRALRAAARGGLLEDLAPVRSRALPLQLLTPERRTGRGILWLDECKLAVLPVAEAVGVGDQAGGAAMALRDRRQQERYQDPRRPGGASGGEGASGTEESGGESGDESDGSALDGDDGAAGTERRRRYPPNDARGYT